MACTPAGVPDFPLPTLLAIGVSEAVHNLLAIGIAPENRAGTLRQWVLLLSWLQARWPRVTGSAVVRGGCGHVSEVWHPAGVLDYLTRFAGGRSPLVLNDHRLPSTNPAGWPPPASSAENVQTPINPQP
jgi:hypothetical protein